MEEIMKLFRRQDRQEGEAFPRDAFLSVGKCHRQEKYDGRYIKFELPFKRTLEYVHPTTFEKATGSCRWCWVLRLRPNAIRKYFTINMWVPINE